MGAVLKIEGLEKSFKKKKVLNQINLSISNGLFGLLGHNGAGKTTLMRIIATLLSPDSGDITLDDVIWSRHPQKVRRILGYLPQDFNVFRNITAYEALEYIAQLKGLNDRKSRKQQIEQLLQEVNLFPHAGDKVQTFSGGMRRRLGVAQALLGNPAIVMVDEPTAGLDPEERIRFRNLLRRFSTRRIVILSTHIVEDIESTCKEVAVLKKGNIRQFHSMEELSNIAAGRVWLWRIPLTNHEIIEKTKGIISAKIRENCMELKLISKEKPSQDAIAVSNPTIEDGYFVWNQTND